VHQHVFIKQQRSAPLQQPLAAAVVVPRMSYSFQHVVLCVTPCQVRVLGDASDIYKTILTDSSKWEVARPPNEVRARPAHAACTPHHPHDASPSSNHTAKYTLLTNISDNTHIILIQQQPLGVLHAGGV
jgi:hypothetical protein